MTAGTRILLLVAALFVGTLVVYYGFIMSPPVATTVGEVSLSPESGDATLKELVFMFERGNKIGRLSKSMVLVFPVMARCCWPK